MRSYETPVVIDNGSCTIKVGLATDSTPRQTFPPIAAHLDEETFIGNAAKNKNVVTKKIIDEEVTDWEDLEELWHQCFTNILKIDQIDHPVLLTNIAFKSKYEKEKTAQIMFEKFKVPATYLAEQTVLSLYSSGCLTGVVLRSGLHKSEAIPIYEGHIMHHPIHRGLYVGGGDITSLLLDNFRKSGHNCDYDAVDEIKQKLCYVSLHSNSEKVKQEAYKLPDGNTLKIGKERFAIPEELFKPKNHWYGVHQMVLDLVSRCDPELQGDLLGNVVLAGGNTLLRGFPERLTQEFNGMGIPEFRINAPEDRGISAWKGGTIVASLPTFRQMWMKKKDYDEDGPGIVHRNCF